MSALPPGLRPQDPYAIVFGPKANCTLDICPVELSVYGYRPSLAANVIFIVLYVIAAAGHVYLGMRWKMWWFMWCMLAGIVNAVLGYAGRVAMWVNPFRFEAFMIQISESLFLPSLFRCFCLFLVEQGFFFACWGGDCSPSLDGPFLCFLEWDISAGSDRDSSRTNNNSLRDDRSSVLLRRHIYYHCHCVSLSLSPLAQTSLTESYLGTE